MALTQAQKDIISASIESFIELPDNAKEFSTAINQLNEALANTVDEQHPFSFVSKCFRTPIACFAYLEKQNAGITYVHEVQEFILERITEIIHVQADKLKLQYQWNNIAAAQFCMLAANKTLIFTTPLAPIDSGEYPWFLPPLEGKIYQRTSRLTVEEPTFDVDFMNLSDEEEIADYFISKKFYHVDVTIPAKGNLPPTSESILVCQLDQHFTTDEAADAYMQTVLQNAEICAEKLAAKIALLSLGKDPSVAEKLSSDPSTRKLITIPYYFTELTSNRLKISSLHRLSDKESNNLASPVVIDLLKHHIISFNTAKSLKSPALRLATHPTYYQLLKNKTLKATTFSSISKQRSYFMTHPVIANLILLNKLSIPNALKLPCETLPIFQLSQYMDFLSRNPMDWNIFSKLNGAQIKLMTHSQFIPYFLNKDISLSELSNYTDEKIFAMRLFFSAFHPLNRIETVAAILNETSNLHMENSAIAERLIELIENILKNKAISLKENAAFRFQTIISQMPYTTECETILDKLIDEAESILGDLRRNRFQAAASSSATPTFFAARKREREFDNMETSATKRSKTDTHDSEETTKTLCHQMIALKDVAKAFLKARKNARLF